MNLGDVTEAAFVYHATLRGYEVFLPVSHHTKTDVAVRVNGSDLVNIQIKKAAKQKQPEHYAQRWKFLLGSGLPSAARSKKDNARADNKPRYNLYTEGDFHVLAAYIMELDTWAFYELTEVIGNASKSWTPKNGPHNNWDLFDKLFAEKS